MHNVSCFVLAYPCVNIKRHKTSSLSKTMAMLKANNKGRSLDGYYSNNSIFLHGLTMLHSLQAFRSACMKHRECSMKAPYMLEDAMHQQA